MTPFLTVLAIVLGAAMVSSTIRNAIALLKLHGAPEEMIRQALSCAAALDRERGTTVLHDRDSMTINKSVK